MAESQTVVILRAKRDAIRAAIANYERQLDQAKNDSRTSRRRCRYSRLRMSRTASESMLACIAFKYGEVADLCRKALEDSAAKSTTDLAKHVMAAKGLDATDKVLARTVAFSVLRSLRGLAKRRVVNCTRHRNRCVWRV